MLNRKIEMRNKQAETISSPQQKQSDSRDHEQEHFMEIRNILRKENDAISTAQAVIKYDQNKIYMLENNLQELVKIVSKYHLANENQMHGVSSKFENAKEEQMNKKIFDARVHELTSEISHQKTYLHLLESNTTTKDLDRINDVIITIANELQSKEKPLKEDYEKIEGNTEGIIGNKGRLDNLEKLADDMTANESQFQKLMEKNSNDIIGQIRDSSNYQKMIKNAISAEQILLAKETNKITSLTNRQHEKAMHELVKIKEQLDEETLKLSKSMKNEFDNINAMIYKTSLDIKMLMSKNDMFLKFLDTMKKYTQRQKEVEEADVSNLKSKLVILSAKLSNQRMAADTQARIQDMEDGLQVVSILQRNQSNLQNQLDRERDQLNQVKLDLHNEAVITEKHLSQLAGNIERGVNKALLTKASRVKLNELKSTVNSLRESKNNLSQELRHRSAAYSNFHSSLSNQLANIEKDIKEKATMIEVNSMRKAMNVFQQEIQSLDNSTGVEMRHLSLALKQYSSKMNEVLREKDQQFQQQKNDSNHLSNSIHNLESSLTLVRKKLAAARQFEEDTKAALLEKFKKDKSKISQLTTVQKEMNKLISAFSKKTELQHLYEVINSTFGTIEKEKIQMKSDFDTLTEKLKKQRSLVTTLAEETASGFTAILSKLDLVNKSIDAIEEVMSSQAKEIDKNQENIEKNKLQIEANNKYLTNENHIIYKNKQDIIGTNERLKKTKSDLVKTVEEVSYIKAKLVKDEAISTKEENQIKELQSGEKKMKKAEKKLMEEFELDKNRIHQLERNENLNANNLDNTNQVLLEVKNNTEENANKIKLLKGNTGKNLELINLNANGISHNIDTIGEHTQQLEKQVKMIENQGSELEKEEKN